MANASSNLVSVFGQLFESHKAVLNRLYEIGGNDEDFAKLRTNPALVNEVAQVLKNGSRHATKDACLVQAATLWKRLAIEEREQVLAHWAGKHPNHLPDPEKYSVIVHDSSGDTLPVGLIWHLGSFITENPRAGESIERVDQFIAWKPQ